MVKKLSIEVLKVNLVREAVLEYPTKTVSGPAYVVDIIRKYIGDPDREHFVAMMLDTKNKINAIHTISIGSINSSSACPREVFKAAILNNASSIILCHNHPSGNPTPSEEDLELTNRLIECGELMGIKIIDHVIIGYGKHYSMAEHGNIVNLK